MSRYASQTTVSSNQSRNEIERLIERYGATGFAYGWQGSRAVISFEMNERRIRFDLPMPDRMDPTFTHHSKGPRAPEAATRAWEQATRQRWRALALLVKAKLEAVESGITVFDEEFLAHVVLPNGRTVGEMTVGDIAIAYQSGEMPLLLAAPA
jgi:hypothetical protein